MNITPLNLKKFNDFVAMFLGKESIIAPSNGLIEMADIDPERAKKIYKMITKMECPEGFLISMGLPEHVKIVWSKEDALGEFDISTPARSDKRLVDESQWELEFFKNKLRNYRVVDEINVNTGPLFVLYQIRGGTVDERLYFFDTRTCWEMDINYPDYIRIAFEVFAPLFWQCLFIDQPLTTSRADSLSKSLDWLSIHAPGETIEMLQKRLKQKIE